MLPRFHHKAGLFAEGQYFDIAQFGQSGFLAWQVFRPCKITV
jgi:hypothetical protein